VCFEPDPVTNCDPAGKVMPVAEYDHGGDRCSVTGGYTYRGTCMPDVQGWYIYADYCSDQMFKFEFVGGQAQNQEELMVNFGTNISSFGEDAVGELYVIILDGVVSRIVASGP